MIFGVVAGSQVTGGGGGGFAPGDFSFPDDYAADAQTVTQTSPSAGTLWIGFTPTYNDGVTNFFVYQNNSEIMNCDLTAPEPTFSGAFSFQVGDTLYFRNEKYAPFPGVYDTVTITLRNFDSTGVIVDEFIYSSMS